MNTSCPPVTEVGERCPGCGAAARADAGWCSLCFAPLRPGPEPAPERTEEPEIPDVRREPGAASVRPVSRGRHARADAGHAASWPVEAIAADTSAEEVIARHAPAADPLLADAMLAQLSAESEDPLGGLAGRLDSAAAKAVAICVGVLLMIVVIMALMFGLGSLL